MIGSARIIRGNALALPLADASVDLICTSPPFFGLRSYTDDGQHYAGQIGSEATPAEFVDALIAATREMVRVLKPSGSIFVNLGDKYAVVPQKWRTDTDSRSWSEANKTRREVTNSSQGGVRSKSLMGIPWRYALRCIDTTAGVPVHIVREMVAAVYNGNLDPRACDEILREYENGGRNAGLGLILRAEIIWAKPNGLPESVTDRVRRSHEQWFHLVKQPRYFSAVDEIRESYAPASIERSAYGYIAGHEGGTNGKSNGPLRSTREPGVSNPLGKLPGSVWTIPTQPLTVPPELGVDHFAAFPMEWPRRIILGWSPAGVCTACGQGRRPIAGHTAEWAAFRQRHGLVGDYMDRTLEDEGGHRTTARPISNGAVAAFGAKHQITGYACGCPEPTAPTRPSTILDPFGGTGTVALVAKALGRIGISVDMSGDYSRLATWRTTDPGQMAAALRVEKPEPVSPDQLDLFSEVL